MKDQCIQDRKMIEVFYYPQCPWVAPVLINLREIAKKLHLGYTEMNLFQYPSLACKRFLLVKVGGEKVPIEVGTSDKEYTERVIRASIEGTPIPSSETVDYEDSIRAQQDFTGKINALDFKTIQPLNITDVVDLCISEDFIYGPLSEEYVDKAKEMRTKWLENLIDRFDFAGMIAYGDGTAIGFIETVPGKLSEGMGISTFNPQENTWVILCLSITRKYWRQGIASILVAKTINHLKGKAQWLEVGAHKKGNEHHCTFYERCGFDTLKEMEKIRIMGHPI